MACINCLAALFESPFVKQAWRSPASLIGNLVSLRESGKFRFNHCARSGAGSLHGTCVRGCGRGDRECCHVGDALLSFALRWFRGRKLPSARGLFAARHVPWSGSTSRGSRNPPPRCGREATGPPTPRSRRPGVASGMHRPKPRRRLIGRRSSDWQFCVPETIDFGGYATSTGRIVI
jgi:hypothetical protein